MGAQFKHAAIHIEDGVTEIVALDDGGRLWWNMQNSDASWQHWSMLPPHPDSVGRESPDDDDDNQAQTGFNRGVSPDGRPCYMHRLGWLQEDRTSPPDVGQIAEAWRPASHGTARVTHVATDSDGVSWIWFESDNRWFPDRASCGYPGEHSRNRHIVLNQVHHSNQ